MLLPHMLVGVNATLDRFVPKSFSHRLDLNLGIGYDAEALRL
jgi:hypothetical protein